MPDLIEYFVAPVDDGKYYRTRFDFWNNVYGFKMTDMREQHLNEPVFGSIGAEQILAKEACFKRIDLNTVKAADLAFVSKYSLKADYAGELNSLAIWFTVSFSMNHVDLWLGGSPYQEKRIFSQLVVYLKNKCQVKKGDVVYGSIAFQNDKEEKFKSHLKVSAHVDAADFENVQYYTIE